MSSGNIYLNIAGIWGRHTVPSQCSVYGFRIKFVREKWWLLEVMCLERERGSGGMCAPIIMEGWYGPSAFQHGFPFP